MEEFIETSPVGGKVAPQVTTLHNYTQYSVFKMFF